MSSDNDVCSILPTMQYSAIKIKEYYYKMNAFDNVMAFVFRFVNI